MAPPAVRSGQGRGWAAPGRAKAQPQPRYTVERRRDSCILRKLQRTVSLRRIRDLRRLSGAPASRPGSPAIALLWIAVGRLRPDGERPIVGEFGRDLCANASEEGETATDGIRGLSGQPYFAVDVSTLLTQLGALVHARHQSPTDRHRVYDLQLQPNELMFRLADPGVPREVPVDRLGRCEA